MSAAAIVLGIGAILVAAWPAKGSEALSNPNPKAPALAVNKKGEAMLTYTMSTGKPRHVLVWGAVNARVPTEGVPQVRFKYDYAGGYRKYHDGNYWRSFSSACAPYDGPALPMMVAGCKAPDGSYWAIQSWQRGLPLLGFKPWLPAQAAYELHISHWTGALPQLTVGVHWTYGHSAIGVFGQFLYQGKPVYGFKSTAQGNPLGRYERNVYIDTHNSAYGPGYARESGILTHNPTGTFCHSFVPQKPFPGYPSRELRPAAPGDEYRFTVMGPGVTPVIQVTAPGLEKWRGAPEQAEAQEGAQRLWDATMTGDKKCAPEDAGAG
ncbi:MAG: hypothetical protein QOH95_89 [Gaiellaceae bacterium]|nr:hypothetical protein [Gaiellaceae bacterium]